MRGGREGKERGRGRKKGAAGGRDGDGKVYTGLLPVTLHTHDFQHTWGCTHSLAHTTGNIRNPFSHPGRARAHTHTHTLTHAESGRSYLSSLPATDTQVQVTTCSITHRQPLPPCPPQPSPSPPYPHPSPPPCPRSSLVDTQLWGREPQHGSV